MQVYLIMFLISLIFAFCAQKTKESIGLVKTKRNISIFCRNYNIDLEKIKYYFFLILSALPFIIVAGMRYNVGTDYIAYTELHIPDVLNGNYVNIEFLYRFVIKIGFFLLRNESYQMIFILTHIIIIAFIYIAIHRLSYNICWSVFILFFSGFYNFSLNIMRQSIACVIFLFAISYIIERKPIHYIISIIVAFLFHTTALIYMPLYFLGCIKLNKKIVPIIIAACILFSRQIRALLVSVATFAGYGHYFNGVFDYGTTQSDFLLFNVAILIFVLLLCEYCEINQLYKYNHKLERYDMTLFNLQTVVVMMCSLSSVIPNSTRMIFVFQCIQIVLLPRLLSTKDIKLQLIQYKENKKPFLLQPILKPILSLENILYRKTNQINNFIEKKLNKFNQLIIRLFNKAYKILDKIMKKYNIKYAKERMIHSVIVCSCTALYFILFYHLIIIRNVGETLPYYFIFFK